MGNRHFTREDMVRASSRALIDSAVRLHINTERASMSDARNVDVVPVEHKDPVGWPVDPHTPAKRDSVPARTFVFTPRPVPPPDEHKVERRDSTKQGGWNLFTVSEGDVQYQKNMVFPLKHIPDNWQNVLSKSRETDCAAPNFRIISCAHDTLVTLKDLYYMPHPGWHAVRDKVKIGLYKETESCGNTSVAMGLAVRYFQKNPTKQVVVFVNCGTGGTRFISYLNCNNVISVLFEAEKDSNGKGTGVLGELTIMSEDGQKVLYESQKQKTSQQITSEISALFAKAPWQQPDFPGRVQHATGCSDAEVAAAVSGLEVFGFVTGSLREEYFRNKHDQEKKAAFRKSVETILSGIKATPYSAIFKAAKTELENDDSYFLSEKLEGQMELFGARTMYQQINSKLKETSNSPEALEPIISFGVGQTSAQWAYLEQADQCDAFEFGVFAYPHGMNNSSRLKGFGKALARFYEKHGKDGKDGPLDTLVKVIYGCLRSGKTPVIALKSGAANYLSRKEGDIYRRAFVENVESISNVDSAQTFRVFYSFGKVQRSAIFNPSTTMARLCADAQHYLGSPADFEGVQVHNKPLKSPTTVKKDDVLEFSGTDTNLTWWPDVDHDLCIQLPLTLLSHFGTPTDVKNQFKNILKLYFESDQATCYDCIASVTRLLWEVGLRENPPSHAAFLEIGEGWYKGVEEEACLLPKHKKFTELQKVPGKFGKLHASSTLPMFNALDPSSFDSLQKKLAKHNISFQACPYYSAKAKPGFLKSSERNEASLVLERVQKVLQTSLCTLSSCETSAFVRVEYPPHNKKYQVAPKVLATLDVCGKFFAIEVDLPAKFRDHTVEGKNVQFSSFGTQELVRIRDELDRANITFEECVPFYLATATDKFVVPRKESQHTAILRVIQTEMGQISSVRFPLQAKNVESVSGQLTAAVKNPTTAIHYCVKVPLSKLCDEPSELFLTALERLNVEGLDLVKTAIRAHIPLLKFQPKAEEIKAGVNMDDLQRIVKALSSMPSMRVVDLETNLRSDKLGEGFLGLVVEVNDDSKHDVPVFYRIRICAFSEVQRLQAKIFKRQEKEIERRDQPAKSHKKPKPIRDLALLNKASTFFRSQEKGIPLALTQGAGEWVDFHRRAQALQNPFKLALERANTHLQELGVQNVEIKAGVKSERSLQRKMKTNSEMSDQVVPLSSLEDKFEIVEDQLTVTDDKKIGPIHGLHAALTLLRRLWSFQDKQWQQVRGKIKIGFIKDTVEHGNTSVSMGVASTLKFDSPYIGFLNCGTGGIKYQMYTATKFLHLVAEYKPEKGCSPNRLAVGSFHPKDELKLEEAQKFLHQELGNESLPWKNFPETPVYAFVTGSMRKCWESANKDEKQLYESVVASLFEKTNISQIPGSTSFFMTQKREGVCELMGTKAMYANLVKDGKLENADVVVSFGIGQGSCQWAVSHSGNPNEVEVFEHDAGMRDVAKLGMVGKELLSYYGNNSNSFQILLETLKNTPNPVIALKSGCLLLLDDQIHIREHLLSPASFIFDYLRGTCFLPPNGADVKSEVKNTLQAINDYVGPIVRIKDQTRLGFLIVNVLFWHAVEAKQGPSLERKVSTGPSLDVQSSQDNKIQYRNLNLICEVQIRVKGAPDDHIVYEIRRNFKDEAAKKPLEESLKDFFSDACNFEFCPYAERRKLTLYQDSRGQISQAFDPRKDVKGRKKPAN